MEQEIEYGRAPEPAPRRRLARRALVAGVLGVTGVAVAALATGSPNPAVGDPPASGVWHEVGDDGGATTLATGWADVSAGNASDPYTLQYKLDADGRVHLRGTVGAVAHDYRTVARWPYEAGGPWAAPLFTLPCGFRPAHTAGVPAGLNDAEGRHGYQGGTAVLADGTVLVTSWDAPVAEIDGDVVWGVIATVQGDFEADGDPGECDEPEPTTTTTEAETTTTTEAP